MLVAVEAAGVVTSFEKSEEVCGSGRGERFRSGWWMAD